MVERTLMVRLVIGSTPHGGPIELFFSSNQTSTGRGMCYHVCGIVHIELLLLIGKSSPCGGSWFPL